MIYTLTSGSIIIANVQDSFNIDDSDWIGRASNWINKALSDLGVISELKVITHIVNATDYRVELPCDIKSLEAISIFGKRVIRSNQVTSTKDETIYYSSNELSYTVQGDNYIQLETMNESFKEVEVTVRFKSLPVEIFQPYGIYIPLVPNIDNVIEAISYYVFIKLLGRGYKHNVFSLTSNHPATNPYLAYYGVNLKGGLRLKARINIKTMDKDARELASISMRSMNHPDRHFTKDYNNIV